jgi:hypothetical protein
VLIGNPQGDPAPLAALARELGRRPSVGHHDAALLAGCDLVLSATGAARPFSTRLQDRAGTII